MTKLAIISGGLREPSSTRLLADRITAAVQAASSERNLTVTASVIELRPLGHPIIDAMLAGFASPDLESAFETVADADGVIAVTPAFNASFSGLFKSFFDVLPEETLSDMPVLIAATAAHALRGPRAASRAVDGSAMNTPSASFSAPTSSGSLTINGRR